jgi:hypothetical protein
VQRQFEDDDGGVCYFETHDHDAYTGHFRLRSLSLHPRALHLKLAGRPTSTLKLPINCQQNGSVKCSGSCA